MSCKVRKFAYYASFAPVDKAVRYLYKQPHYIISSLALSLTLNAHLKVCQCFQNHMTILKNRKRPGELQRLFQILPV